jgi:hypothetical protein
VNKRLRRGGIDKSVTFGMSICLIMMYPGSPADGKYTLFATNHWKTKKISYT